MKFLGTILLFFGYTLIYAAVAHAGKFATDPWNGVFADAYVDVPSGGGASTPATSTPATPGSTGTGAPASTTTKNFARPRTTADWLSSWATGSLSQNQVGGAPTVGPLATNQ